MLAQGNALVDGEDKNEKAPTGRLESQAKEEQLMCKRNVSCRPFRAYGK